VTGKPRGEEDSAARISPRWKKKVKKRGRDETGEIVFVESRRRGPMKFVIGQEDQKVR